MQIILLIIIVVILVKFTIDSKKRAKNEDRSRWIEGEKEYNRNMLKTCGKNEYIKRYGLEAYESIMNDTDTHKFFGK